jgi:hypothetical protein
MLRQRIEVARAQARSKGALDNEINLLLSGLALLPPPVPIEELACACGMPSAQAESFAADLAPLLERTRHGLMFRDEPTEDVIRRTHSVDMTARSTIVTALFARQVASNYAARALPALLTNLGEADSLIALAFDERVPLAATQVSIRDIRLARISAAIALCVVQKRREDLIKLLLEASVVAAGHERADRFLYEYPDLTAIADDAEALRRLFSTQVGWPGGRHAAIALAYAFGGDFNEARRHARRAIEWHDLARDGGENEVFEPGKASTRLDEIGFAYVEALAGNDVRVANFFARQKPETAFGAFCTLFDLFERHLHTNHPPSERLRRRLQRCRLASPALWAAALQYSQRDSAQDRQFIRRLAAACKQQPSVPLALCLPGAAQAIALACPGEAKAILASTNSARPHLYSFGRWGGDEQPELLVVQAGLTAAVHAKPVTLMQLVPNELLLLVPRSLHTRGAATFERALRQRLEEAANDGKRRRKNKLDYRRRTEYRNTLQHRIEPLLPYAQVIADLVKAADAPSARRLLCQALAQLAQDVEKSSEYPFTDGKAYRARVGFKALFQVADAVGVIDAEVASHMVTWLTEAPGFYIPQLTGVIERFSREATCHDSALDLAKEVERRILLETEIGARISAYGSLARAVWRIAPEEAAVYFRRPLDLAEAVGSEDFDRTNFLLELTGHYQGQELTAEAGHTLARIFELNQNDDAKFPWSEYAKAMVPIAGLSTLAVIARLDDRDNAALGLSLGPSLTQLLRHGKVSGDIATSLIGLAAPIESWTWSLGEFAEFALASLPAQHHEWFFEQLLIELDRNDQLSPPRFHLEAWNRLAAEYLPNTSPSRVRLAALLKRLRLEPTTSPREPRPNPSANVAIDLADPVAIDRMILEQEPVNGHRWPLGTLRDLAHLADQEPPARRLAFVQAVVTSGVASLSDKIWALDKFLPIWGARSPAMDLALPELGLRLARLHAEELLQSESWRSAGWDGLLTYFHSDRSGLVDAVLEGLGSSVAEVSGDAWLGLAAKLAPSVRDAALAEGLTRLLKLAAVTLPGEIGDGPWTPELALVLNPEGVTAGLIWARLGHSHAPMRWRAVHAVSRLAAVKRFDVIAHLIQRFTDSGIGPFGDAKLPAYPMHAQLWLLIALARIALDHPQQLVVHLQFFEQVAFADNFPHVVMRAFAIDTLRVLAAVLDPSERDKLLQRLDNTNRSPFPQVMAREFQKRRYLPKPDTAQRGPEAFHLDYDFSKYHVERLCRVFSCAEWEIESRMTHWVHGWDANAHSMYDDPRARRSYENDWSSGSMPEVDRYGGYLGWHALMLCAGEFLQTREVTRDEWSDDAWADFIEHYRLSCANGQWLAELTDLFPVDLPDSDAIPMPETDNTASERDDHELLQPMLGISEAQLTSESLPVSGRWSISTDCTVSLSSVLVTVDDLSAVVMTLLTEGRFFCSLPEDPESVESHFGGSGHGIRTWIDGVARTDSNLDQHDPYAFISAQRRPAPSAWVRDQLGLVADDVGGRCWSNSTGVCFRTEAWGATGGRGEHRWEVGGHRINVDRSCLLSLLKSEEVKLIGVLKMQRYLAGRAGGTGNFSHRLLVFNVDSNGRVELFKRAKKFARDAIVGLDKKYRHDFRHRFDAIRAALKARPGSRGVRK